MSEEAFQREMFSFIFYENEGFTSESAVLNLEKKDPQLLNSRVFWEHILLLLNKKLKSQRTADH